MGHIVFIGSFFVQHPFRAHVSQGWAAALLASETVFVVGVLVNTAVTRGRRH
jgi:hypothetical protein